jgi:RNA polymerase sigma factor (sigma-70 family)
MPQEPLARALGQLRRLLGGRPAEDTSDGQLLERFCAARDEAAFAALMRRHGPLVLSVCRRLLTDADDVEDAFQAAFMVLVRRASGLRREGSLGSWLYGVAYRVALKARTTSARRRKREQQAPLDATENRPVYATTPDVSDESAGPFDRAACGELHEVLDAEVNRLPEKYRAPLVLCYLEGKTNEQAAQELGCPPGSMSWRLGQARDRLRSRLEGRGIVLSAAALAALTQQSSAAVPPALGEATLRAAVRLAAGEAAAEVLSAQASLLTESALQGLGLSGRKLLAIALCTALMLGTAGSLLVYRLVASERTAADPQAAAWAASVEERVAQWQPTPEERRLDLIGWAPDLLAAERLAKDHNRPVFLFTHDGRINTGRCGGSAFNLRAFSLADERVIALLNRSFVPVYSCNDGSLREGFASEAVNQERQRIYSAALDAKMTAGTDCIYILTPDGTVFDAINIRTAKKVDLLLERLHAAVTKLRPSEGPPVVAPQAQSVLPAVPPGGIVLHLTARVFGRTAWCEFPSENWIVLSAEQATRLLPPETCPVGSFWDIDADLQRGLLTYFYPQTENNGVSTNLFERHTLRARVISVGPTVTRVRLDGGLRMKHTFYPTRPDDYRVDATVDGYIDFDTTTRRIRSVRLATEQAIYGPWSFAVAVRSVP